MFSDSDELEDRISSGINLSTSALAYGGLANYAILLKRMQKGDAARKITQMQTALGEAIENYFGGEVGGYHTYRYHKGCEVIRAWNSLPIYMGIASRAEDTLKSIDEKLWTSGSCRSTENEKILWDRSALYYIMALFRAGKTETAWEKLKEYSKTRLLGERVPYAVEAYPEGGMRQLSGESGLYCRVFTDGLLNIRFDEKGYTVNGILPKELNEIKARNICLNGKTRRFVSHGKPGNCEKDNACLIAVFFMCKSRLFYPTRRLLLLPFLSLHNYFRLRCILLLSYVWHCGGCLNKRAARLRLAVQAPAITTTEQGGTQSARERAVAAEPLGDPPLSPVQLYLSCNANVYRRYPYIDGFSLFVYLQYRKVSVLLRKVYFHLLTLKAKNSV